MTFSMINKKLLIFHNLKSKSQYTRIHPIMKICTKSLLLITICTIISISCFAQNSGIRDIERNEEEDLERPADVFRIGITPSALINTYIGLQINGAVNFSDRVQFNMEAGVIVSSSAFNSTKTQGHRLRPALRWYVTHGTEYRFHLSIGYNIRYTKSQRISGFSSPDGSIFNNFPYEQERKVTGPAFLVGVDYWLNNRIVLDLGFGLGSGRVKITDLDTPPNSTKSESFFVNDSPGTSNFPIIILNIRFQYVL